MIQILLNATLIYGLFSVFTPNSTEEKIQNSTEIAVVTIIGMFIAGTVLRIYLGKYVGLAGAGLWIFFAFRWIGKIPAMLSVLSAILVMAINVVWDLYSRKI